MRQTSSLLTVVPDVNMLKDEIHNIVMDLPRGEQKFRAESGSNYTSITNTNLKQKLFERNKANS